MRPRPVGLWPIILTQATGLRNRPRGQPRSSSLRPRRARWAFREASERRVAALAQTHDVVMLEASVLVVAVLYMLSNLIADIVVALLNPRIRMGG